MDDLRVLRLARAADVTKTSWVSFGRGARSGSRPCRRRSRAAGTSAAASSRSGAAGHGRRVRRSLLTGSAASRASRPREPTRRSSPFSAGVRIRRWWNRGARGSRDRASRAALTPAFVTWKIAWACATTPSQPRSAGTGPFRRSCDSSRTWPRRERRDVLPGRRRCGRRSLRVPFPRRPRPG